MDPNIDLLQFKDFSNESSTSSVPAQIDVNSTMERKSARVRGDPLSDLSYDMTATTTGALNDIESDDEQNASSPVSFLTFEYYQQFFRIDAFMVLERIVKSIVPKRAEEDYLQANIGKNPDLYGPFWINVTLIFSIAISGNIASYFQQATNDYYWRYNFHLVSSAATCIFFYINFLPAALWGLFKYSLKPTEDDDLDDETSGFTPSLLSLVCVYGYSLSIYIPVSILWVVQISVFQWILVITAAFLSGTALILVLRPALRNSKISLFLIIGILGAHLLLAAGFMLYFFHVRYHVTEENIVAEKGVSGTSSALNVAANSMHSSQHNSAINSTG